MAVLSKPESPPPTQRPPLPNPQQLFGQILQQSRYSLTYSHKSWTIAEQESLYESRWSRQARRTLLRMKHKMHAKLDYTVSKAWSSSNNQDTRHSGSSKSNTKDAHEDRPASGIRAMTDSTNAASTTSATGGGNGGEDPDRPAPKKSAPADKPDIPTIHRCGYGSCKRVFETAEELLQHRIDAKHFPKNICDYPGCGEVFRDSQKLLRHRRKEKHWTAEVPDPGKNEYRCDYPGCDKSYPLLDGLNTHRQAKQHWTAEVPDPGKKEYRCDYPGCDKVYPYSGGLNRHRQATQHWTAEVPGIGKGAKQVPIKQKYRCDYPGCDKSCKSSPGLTVHRRETQHYTDANPPPKKDPEREKYYRCAYPDCHGITSHGFALLDDLRAHCTALKHDGRWVNCKRCHKTFPNDSYLTKEQDASPSGYCQTCKARWWKASRKRLSRRASRIERAFPIFSKSLQRQPERHTTRQILHKLASKQLDPPNRQARSQPSEAAEVSLRQQLEALQNKPSPYMGLLQWLFSDTPQSQAYLAKNPNLVAAILQTSDAQIQQQVPDADMLEANLLQQDRILGLHGFNPLAAFRPIQVVGDGNCMFRAAARLIYGHEGYHLAIRRILGGWYARATGSYGFDLDPVLNNSRGAVYHTLQEQSDYDSSREDRQHASLESQLFRGNGGEGIWGSLEVFQLLADFYDVAVFVHTPHHRPGTTATSWELTIRGDPHAQQEQLHFLNLPNIGHFVPLVATTGQARYVQGTIHPTQLAQMRDPITTHAFTGQHTQLAPIPQQIRQDFDPRPAFSTGLPPLRLRRPNRQLRDDQLTIEALSDLPRRNTTEVYPVPRVVKKPTIARAGAGTAKRAKQVLEELTTFVTASELRRFSERRPLIQFGSGHTIDLETADEHLDADGREYLQSQHNFVRQDVARGDLLELPRALLEQKIRREIFKTKWKISILSGLKDWPADDSDWSEWSSDSEQESSDDDSDRGDQPDIEQDMHSANGTQDEDMLDASSVAANDEEDAGSDQPFGEDDWPASEAESDPDLQAVAIHVADAPILDPSVWIFGRFSDTREPDVVQQAFGSNIRILRDWINLYLVERMADPNLPNLRYPHDVRNFIINGRSAAEFLPTYDSPYVPPEILQLLQAMNIMVQMGQRVPPIYWIFRSMSALSVARAYQRFFDHYRRFNPHLEIYVVFALRQPYITGITGSGFMARTSIRFMNNTLPSGRGMFYT